MIPAPLAVQSSLLSQGTGVCFWMQICFASYSSASSVTPPSSTTSSRTKKIA